MHHAGQDFILSGRSVAGIEQHRAAGVGRDIFSPHGGSAAALALAYAAQGGRASLLTQLGEDVFGHRIADALSTAGVDISRVRFTSRAPTPLLFDGGGEQLGCRTRSSELLYAPEQLGADWAADAEILAFSSACLVDSPCRYTHLAALDTARTADVRSALFPLSVRPSGPAKRPCGTR